MSAANPRVLIVSKPFAPPWNDGSKNMARDLVFNSQGIEFHVLTVPDHGDFPDHVTGEITFKSGGSYQPAMNQNLATLARLLRPDRKIDIYHFFFAPNARTCAALKMLMRFKKQKTLHTIASAPNDFNQARNWLFADRNVAVSEHSKKEFNRFGISNIETVYPGIHVLSDHEIQSVSEGEWGKLKDGADAVFLYPGDYEFSGGHDFLLGILPEIIRRSPRIKIIFACRTKTPEAKKIEASVKAKFASVPQVIFLNEINNIRGLLKVCDAVIFPVKSLYKKVDIPLTLLEAMSFGKPVIASGLEPLRELILPGAGVIADLNNSYEWTDSMLKMVSNSSWKVELGVRARRRVMDFFSAKIMAKNYEKIYRELLNL